MILSLAKRMLTEIDARLLAKFLYTFGWKSIGAVRRFERRRARGVIFPAFMFLSVTNRCNLNCQGCWVDVNGALEELTLAEAERVIDACKKQGGFFFGILGGEPLLWQPLLELFRKHRDCYFQLFTNGTLLDRDFAAALRKLGNVTPLISVEGLEQSGDARRGGEGVFRQAMGAVENCRQEKLVIGAASSICQSNFAELVCEKFLDDLIARGVHYMWYYIYRPSGANPCPELALDEDQILRLREFMVEMRDRKNIALIDAYWDADGNALCPAVTGISYHVSPGGQIEPCPPVQFACENIRDGGDLCKTVSESEFLAAFRKRIGASSRGCVLLENPELLIDLIGECGAKHTTSRDGLAELQALGKLPCHHLPGKNIPEKNWAYRFAKKNWFFGFGAYG